MKQKLAYVLAAVAMLATTAATLGSVWWSHDEPNSITYLYD